MKDEMRSSGPSEGDTEISEDHIAIPIAALGAHSATQSYDSRAVYEPMLAIMSGRETDGNKGGGTLLFDLFNLMVDGVESSVSGEWMKHP